MLAATQPKKLSKQDEAKIAAEILRVRTDLFYFLETYVWTLDEDAAKGESPIKRFPSREERPDIYEIAALWLNEEGRDELRRLGLDKSRQMMGTWVFICCDLWDTAFHPGVRTFFQSKKEKDAINLLERAWFVFQRLPKWLKPTHQKKETELVFPKLDSLIWAIPQGGDHIRSYTASNVFSDEAAKQPEFGEAYAASIPSIGKRGRLHFLSTARGKGNAFFRLRKKPPKVEELPGYPMLNPFINEKRITVAFLDYRFNPKYDDDWVARIKPTMTEAEWNREFEGSYEEAVGTPVVTIDPTIHFRKFQWLDGKVFWRGWDFGYRRPAFMATQYNRITDQWYWLCGMVGENETITDFANRVFEILDAKFPPYRDGQGNMQQQEWLDYCDPAGTQKSDKSDTTSIEQLETAHFKRYGRYMNLQFRKMSFEDGINIIRARAKVRANGEPGLLIHEDFQDCKDGLTGGYQFPETRKSGDMPEYPLADGFYIHLLDCPRYIGVCIPEFQLEQASMGVDDAAWPQPWNEEDQLGIGQQHPLLAGITH